MLSFTNLALRRGPNLLFEDVSFVIHRDKKVGLIGANGAGKTSLFKMITGDLDVEEGYLDHPHDLRISYLAQEVAGTDEVAVLSSRHPYTARDHEWSLESGDTCSWNYSKMKESRALAINSIWT